MGEAYSQRSTERQVKLARTRRTRIEGCGTGLLPPVPAAQEQEA